MLHNLNSLISFTLDAEDGEIGRVHDFLFDEKEWVIRYLVADTGKWLPGRKVVISPAVIGSAEEKKDRIDVDLTKDQIRNSPPLSDKQPLSSKSEEEVVFYYSWPAYWAPPGQFGRPIMVSPTELKRQIPPGGLSEPPPPNEQSSRLRSFKETDHSQILAKDGKIGHVADFVADDEHWVIRYMVVDTGHWLPGRKVLIAPEWITAVIWEDSAVEVDLTREEIKKSPEYDGTKRVDRDYEDALHDHYRRPKYWE